ncbi:hypothetical protein NQ315_013261 [Exocentrus adspersus]|uniref:Uncharacterized protein n=1 Tax=Exocentrus adspersus TaxID=1586481 RepID=A0AAV8VKI9_9CUCU|nr:hypothetical protein NQ315_013261 [Exocentrus adspersus]
MLEVPQLGRYITIQTVAAVGIRISRYGEITVTSSYHPSGRTILEKEIEALLGLNSRQLNPSGAALILENTVDVVVLGTIEPMIEPTFDGQGYIASLKATPVEMYQIESKSYGSVHDAHSQCAHSECNIF